MRRALILAALLASAGCPGHGGGAQYKQPGAAMTVNDVLAKLAAQHAERASFTGESVMDYWLGDQRLKGTVLVMGTSQRQVRFNALSPQGGGVLADMACNGTDFTYVDFQNNCQLDGPCNADSIATLLRVQLEPDDFLRLAVGLAPAPEQATGEVTWDGAKGAWRVSMSVPRGVEKLTIDARDGHFDVVEAHVDGTDAGAGVLWSVENTDFQDVTDAAGKAFRVPGKTHFKSPPQQADLLVEWQQRALNVSLDSSKFIVQAPSGLPRCGAAK